jgi:hypothetical protein
MDVTIQIKQSIEQFLGTVDKNLILIFVRLAYIYFTAAILLFLGLKLKRPSVFTQIFLIIISLAISLNIDLSKVLIIGNKSLIWILLSALLFIVYLPKLIASFLTPLRITQIKIMRILWLISGFLIVIQFIWGGIS